MECYTARRQKPPTTNQQLLPNVSSASANLLRAVLKDHTADRPKKISRFIGKISRSSMTKEMREAAFRRLP